MKRAIYKKTGRIYLVWGRDTDEHLYGCIERDGKPYGGTRIIKKKDLQFI